jgi:hypothetical protein
MQDFVEMMAKRYIMRVFNSAAGKFDLMLKFKKVKFRAKHVFRKFRHHIETKRAAMSDLKEIFWDQFEIVEHWEGHMEQFFEPGEISFKLSENEDLFTK